MGGTISRGCGWSSTSALGYTWACCGRGQEVSCRGPSFTASMTCWGACPPFFPERQRRGCLVRARAWPYPVAPALAFLVSHSLFPGAFLRWYAVPHVMGTG